MFFLFFYFSGPYQVLLGSHNLKGMNKKILRIENTCKPSTYQKVGLGDDIMLIKVSIYLPHTSVNFIKHKNGFNPASLTDVLLKCAMLEAKSYFQRIMKTLCMRSAFAKLGH